VLTVIDLSGFDIEGRAKVADCPPGTTTQALIIKNCRKMVEKMIEKWSKKCTKYVAENV
jgi:hypothetical protein